MFPSFSGSSRNRSESGIFLAVLASGKFLHNPKKPNFPFLISDVVFKLQRKEKIIIH